VNYGWTEVLNRFIVRCCKKQKMEVNTFSRWCIFSCSHLHIDHLPSMLKQNNHNKLPIIWNILLHHNKLFYHNKKNVFQLSSLDCMDCTLRIYLYTVYCSCIYIVRSETN
jgi:hypothetical protein